MPLWSKDAQKIGSLWMQSFFFTSVGDALVISGYNSLNSIQSPLQNWWWSSDEWISDLYFVFKLWKIVVLCWWYRGDEKIYVLSYQFEPWKVTVQDWWCPGDSWLDSLEYWFKLQKCFSLVSVMTWWSNNSRSLVERILHMTLFIRGAHKQSSAIKTLTNKLEPGG